MPMKSPFLRSVTLKEKPDDLDAFPFSIPALHAGFLELDCNVPVTFFVGENGSGKSTVMEAIAMSCGFNPSGGGRNNVYDYKPTESSLAAKLRLVWNFKVNSGFFLRAESFFSFASYLDKAQEELPGEDYYGPVGRRLNTRARAGNRTQSVLWRYRKIWYANSRMVFWIETS